MIVVHISGGRAQVLSKIPISISLSSDSGEGELGREDRELASDVFDVLNGVCVYSVIRIIRVYLKVVGASRRCFVGN